MSNWLWDKDQEFRSKVKLLEWIGGGDSAWSRLWRLGLVIGALFLFWFLESGLGKDQDGQAWWWGPAGMSSILVVPYVFWRLIEWRRRRERRRNPPVRTLDLS